MKTLFRNTLYTDGIDVYENFEDAHGSSIQSACWKLDKVKHEEDKNYNKDQDALLASASELAEAAKVLLAAIDGKYVVEYVEAKK